MYLRMCEYLFCVEPQHQKFTLKFSACFSYSLLHSIIYEYQLFQYVIHACKFDTGNSTTDWTTTYYTKVRIATLISWFVNGPAYNTQTRFTVVVQWLTGAKLKTDSTVDKFMGFWFPWKSDSPLDDLTKGASCLFRLNGSATLQKLSEVHILIVSSGIYPTFFIRLFTIYTLIFNHFHPLTKFWLYIPRKYPRKFYNADAWLIWRRNRYIRPAS